MKMKKTLYMIALAACLSGCAAKQDPESTADKVQKYLDEWLATNHPGKSIGEDGICILEDKPGTGAEWDASKPYSKVILVVRSLSGGVSACYEEQLDKQLGNYSPANYYGYRVMNVSSGYAGQEAMLKGMKEGGERTALIPLWMLTTNRYSSQKEYKDNCPGGASLVYTIRYGGQVEDIVAATRQELKDYVSANFGPDINPVSFNDASGAADIFYFIPDQASIQGKEELATDASIGLDYTGTVVGGQLFDTTVEKVAKDAGIWNSARTYGKVKIKLSDSYATISMSGNSNLVDGFKGALAQMKYPGEKGVAIFCHDLGYGSSGNGKTIPPYAILRFDLSFAEAADE